MKPIAVGILAFVATIAALNARYLANFVASGHHSATRDHHDIQFAGSADPWTNFHGSERGAPAGPSPRDAGPSGLGAPSKPQGGTSGASKAPARPAEGSGAAATPAGGSREAKECGAEFQTEHWGDVVVWGSSNKQASWQDCCASCRSNTGGVNGGVQAACNVWVYCGDEDLCGKQHRECWLKHLVNPKGSRPRAQGEGVGWTSGILPGSGNVGSEDDADLHVPGETAADRKYHYVISAQVGRGAGAGPARARSPGGPVGPRADSPRPGRSRAQGSATHWQARVNYYWWRHWKGLCLDELGDECTMGGYTRILHSGQPDDLSEPPGPRPGPPPPRGAPRPARASPPPAPAPAPSPPQWTRSPPSCWTPSRRRSRTRATSC